MASSPRAGTVALRAAVRDTKAILVLAKITLAASPSDGEVTPDVPRMYQLNDEQLKKFLPGTMRGGGMDPVWVTQR